MTPRRFRTLDGLRAFIAAHPGRALHMLIEHDDVCTPDSCRCKPHFVLRDLTPANFVEGQKLQREWERTSTS